MDKGSFACRSSRIFYLLRSTETNKAPLSCSGKGAIIYSAAGLIESFAAAFVFDF